MKISVVALLFSILLTDYLSAFAASELHLDFSGILNGLDALDNLSSAPEHCENQTGAVRVNWFGPVKYEVLGTGLPFLNAVGLLTVTTQQRSFQCTELLIAGNIQLIAGHCFREGNELITTMFDINSKFDDVARMNLISESGGDDDNFIQKDYAVLKLSTPAPNNVPVLEIAQPQEVYVGMQAMTVGYKSNLRIRGIKCTIKGFEGNFILSDCPTDPGYSGGPLLVLTQGEKWTVAGITSERREGRCSIK